MPGIYQRSKRASWVALSDAMLQATVPKGSKESERRRKKTDITRG